MIKQFSLHVSLHIRLPINFLALRLSRLASNRFQQTLNLPYGTVFICFFLLPLTHFS